MAFAHSSVIVTGAAVDTRAADQLSFPFLARPQLFTLYVRFMEVGTALASQATGTEKALIQVGNNANPRMGIFCGTNGSYKIYHLTSLGTVQSALAASPSIGTTVELRAVLNSNGSVFIGQSLNGAAETLSATSGALALGQAWSAQAIWFNAVSASGNVGFAAFRNVEVRAGVHTLQEMRAYAGVE